MRMFFPGKIVFVLGLALLSTIALYAQGRHDIDFNENWQFRKADLKNIPAMLDDAWNNVTLPHTWNATDMQTSKIFYQGDAFYKKTFPGDPAWKSKRVFIRFEGVGQVADVFLNDQFLGQHKGGYSAFVAELTYGLKFDALNKLVVKANNESREDVIPINHNLFGVYGGIYRPVKLIVTGKLGIAVTDYASAGITISQENVSAANADIIVQTKLDNKFYEPRQVVLETIISDNKGKGIKKIISPVTVLPQGLQTFTQKLQIKKPHLWNGTEDPYLYKITVRVMRDKEVVEEKILPLGIRYYEIIAGKGFYLNGKPYRLKGVCRHQDRWGAGSALSNEQHAEDLAIIGEMGANSIRLAHYQQSDYFYSKCDSLGFLIWAEIPFVNAVSKKETENAKQQLTELIRQSYNHPSIYTWGLHNEVYGKNPADFVSVLTAELHALAKKEDPYRYTVSVNGYGTMERNENRLADIQGMNRYYGWYEGETTDLENWVSGLEKNYPGYKVMLSEYGAEANVDQQTEPPLPAFNPVNGQYFPEQLSTRSHEIQWGIIEKHPYLAASYLWNMFDFAVPLWSRGGVPARNMKGLVTFDRKIKKDVFYWYKANWSKESVLYISDRRLVKRKNTNTAVTVYSNVGQPVLTVNGRVITAVNTGTTSVHYIFENVQLDKGINKISVAVSSGEAPADKVEWSVE